MDSKMTIHELPPRLTGRPDQAQVSEGCVISANNSASETPESNDATPPDGFAVAAHEQEGVGNRAGSSPAGDVDQVHRIAAANRYILLELDSMRKRLAIAHRGMVLLETVSKDWNEAADVVRKWKEAIKDRIPD